MNIRNILITGAAFAGLTLASCNKQLEQVPATSKELGSFMKTETEVEEYVNAVYASLQVRGQYGLYIPALGEIPSDNTFDEVPANDGSSFGQPDLFATIPSNGMVIETWRTAYQGIQRANTVLNRIEAVPFKSEDTKKARKGAMKFIRALYYFNLVRVYGDVPLVIEETTDANAYFGQGRMAKGLVYTQIIKDLSEAVTELPADAEKPGMVTKGAAQALLGKVYLTLSKWPEAKAQLEAVSQSEKYALLEKPADIFAINNESNKEIIFSVQFASGINGNSEGSTMHQQFSPSGTVSNAKGHNLPTKSLYNLYVEGDQRRDAYIGLTDNGIPFTRKIVKPTTTPADGGSNFVVLRYADVILMLAEVENEMANTVAAAGYLNSIRLRAGLKETTATTAETLREAIALERRFELIGEGHRWFDLVRTGKAVSVMNAWFDQQNVNITVDEHHLVQPVPQGQVDTDPSIKQNPGY